MSILLKYTLWNPPKSYKDQRSFVFSVFLLSDDPGLQREFVEMSIAAL